jgi:general secretion pathway protein K
VDQSRDSRDEGFALVLVLWAMVLLAAMGAALLREVRAERESAGLRASRFIARQIADGGINQVIMNLIDPAGGQRWRIDGTPRSTRLFDHDLVLQLTSEAGKIDLNAAPPSLLAALFRSQGLVPDESETLAARVVDWRTPLAEGAPDPAANAYREAALTYGPRHGSFRAVGELRLVLGMTDALQDAVAPLVTVYTRSSSVDRGAAGNGVLNVLEEAGDTLAATQLNARSEGTAAGVNRPVAVGEVVTISARLTIDGLAEERIAVVQLGGDQQRPYRVLEWR